MYEETSSGLWLPSSEIESEERGFDGRITRINPHASQFSFVLDYDNRADEAILTKKSIKNLQNKTKVSEVLPTLIRSFPMFFDAMNLYKQNINQGYEFYSENENVQREVESMFDELASRGKSLDQMIEEQVYAMLAEGAVSFELNMEDDELQDFSYVSPNSLTHRQPNPNPEQIYQIGQKRPNGEFILLFDETDPDYSGVNQFFFYSAVNKMGDKPRGVSIFATAISAALGKLDLDQMLTEFTRGQAFPRGFLSPKVGELIQSGVTGQKLIDTLKKSVTELQNKLNNAGLSESVISSLGFEWVLMGLMGRSNINGAELINNNFLFDIQVALDIPDTLLPRRTAAVLGEQSGGTQWTRWQNALRYYRIRFASELERAIQVVLYRRGFEFNRYPVKLLFDDNDRQSRLYEAETVRAEMEAYQVGIDAGIITAEQAFNLIKQKNKDFQELEFEGGVALEQPEPEGEPNATE